MLIRPMHQEWEMWKWLAIISLAAALSLALASAVGATGRPPTLEPPRLLPPRIDESAKPMTPEASTITQEYAPDDLVCQLWAILELHRGWHHEAAINAWNELPVPPETAFWKWIALGQASTATGRLEEAEAYLSRAMELRPENAMAYYFRGILRLHQARVARDWDDSMTLSRTRLVAFGLQPVVPNTKSMYEFAAIVDLEKAIELAHSFKLDQLLVPEQFPTRAALEPTAGDLLLALGADGFAAKAHNTLGYLHLERGALELSEEHMDGAALGGLDVVYGYRELAEEYRACGRHDDAMRAYLKATKFDVNKTRTLFEALRSFFDVLQDQ